MGEESEKSVLFDSDLVLNKYVSFCLFAAKKSAERCGCGSCCKHYQSWLDWINDENRSVDDMPDGRDFHSRGSSRFPTDLNDDPPPDINSGNLADWYARGL